MNVTSPSRPASLGHPSSYTDFSSEVEDSRTSRPSSTRKGRERDPNFPVKLHYMLCDMEADGLHHIISWQPHGRCFMVHKEEAMIKDILPLWFQQTKYASFRRQLNLYGFKTITRGPDMGGIYHELFLRGKRFLAHRIPRMKNKGVRSHCPRRGEATRRDAEAPPDFYRMPFLPAEDYTVSDGTRTETTRKKQEDQRMSRQDHQLHLPLPPVSKTEVPQPKIIPAKGEQAEAWLQQEFCSSLLARGQYARTTRDYSTFVASPTIGATTTRTQILNSSDLVALRERALIAAYLMQHLHRR